MERDLNESGLLELGTASTDTHGQPILSVPEQRGYEFQGFIAD